MHFGYRCLKQLPLPDICANIIKQRVLLRCYYFSFGFIYVKLS